METEARLRIYLAAGFAIAIFLLVQLGALALVPTFYDQGYQAVEDPSDPTNSLLYIGAILVATALMLGAFKFDLDWVVRVVIVFTSGLISWYVFGAIVPGALGPAGGPLSIVLAVAVAIALLVHPEWYVIDAAGVLMGAGAAGLFGISFGLLPALVLLGGLAIYDAISVYGTRHMLDLAEGVMDLRIPVVLVVPLTLSYSLRADDFSGANEIGPDAGERERGDRAHGERAVDDLERAGDGGSGENSDNVDDGDEDDSQGPGRDAFFIGLGDAVMPAVMVASGAFFSPAEPLGFAPLPALNLPALFAMVGTLAGLVVLLRWVLGGRAHAGLPLLNGGAIGGYLIGSLVAGVPLFEALGLAAYL